MFSFLAYIKFLFTSSDQHGVHSPFVYQYTTQCLYSKQKKSKNKTENVFLKSIDYFNFKTIKTDNKGLILTQDHYSQIPYDLVHLSEPKNAEIYLKNIHNDSMLLLKNIHKSIENEKIWRQIKNNKQVTVTLDLFYCGVIFFRKEQTKEHFKIRI
ncbi:hypothetical protein GGR42_002861 [Saonia flava]|uniref:Uncharacterized protein n=1 Tax=Saonia flava TaxID=523696 RepID=A0A846QZM6_9FLAO|nr:hypothetical protein [Saonia flava]NJB72370.1 hypothetical protein [Saonia flava]